MQTLVLASATDLASHSLDLRHLALELELALEDDCLAETEVVETGRFVRSYGHS